MLICLVFALQIAMIRILLYRNALRQGGVVFHFGTAFVLQSMDSFMGNLIENIVGRNSNTKSFAKLLDLASLKNKVSAANIANVETPGYERKTLDFDGELKKSMASARIKPVETHPRHIPLSNSNCRPPKIISIKNSENSTGVNSVDIDQEMAELAQNQITYQFGSKMLSKKFNSLRDAIKGR